MILLIDNYDSFTYNLVHYFKMLRQDCRVVYNDAITVADIQHQSPEFIVISPGPGTPMQAGISLDIIRAFAGVIPILGVCLGHQCIAQYYGANIVHAKRIMHGKTSAIYHKGTDLFQDLPSPFQATRYHSLIIEPRSLPAYLQVTAWTQDRQEIMAIAHEKLAVFGVQFHPEAILSDYGHALLSNFLRHKNACATA